MANLCLKCRKDDIQESDEKCCNKCRSEIVDQINYPFYCDALSEIMGILLGFRETTRMNEIEMFKWMSSRENVNRFREGITLILLRSQEYIVRKELRIVGYPGKLALRQICQMAPIYEPFSRSGDNDYT